MGKVIEIEHLEKKFGENGVLCDISLVCEKGKIYGITGYNGSGKSVLFKCICGFLLADKGKIIINGKERREQSAWEDKIGFIIEEPAFLMKYSGYENLKLLYMLNHKTNRAYLEEMLQKVGLDSKSKKRVGDYSLGMKQRLAIAQATMENPDILVMDEPMNGLDKNGVAQMRAYFLDLKRQGKTMLLASHNREDIDILCDEVYEMEQGKLNKIR